MAHGGHTGSKREVGVRDIVDDWAPGEEVGRGLVDEFLAVQGVPLVAVVDYELGRVGHEEGFPDGGKAVVGEGLAA